MFSGWLVHAPAADAGICNALALPVDGSRDQKLGSPPDDEVALAADAESRGIEWLLERCVRLAVRRARWVLAIAVVGAVVSIGYASAKLGFKTSRSDLIHPGDVTFQNWQRFAAEFGDDADIVFCVDGHDRGQVIAALETLARDLRAQPALFEKTCHRINVDRLRAKGLYQLSPEALAKVSAHVDRMKPLLWGGWRLFSLDSVLAATQLQLAGGLDAADNVVTATAMLDSLATSIERPGVYRSPWRAAFAHLMPRQATEIPDYFFSRDGRLGFLRTIPRKNIESFTGFTEPVRVARAIVARTARAFPELKFGLTGLPVLEDDEMQAAQRASGWSTVLSIVGVALLFFFGFKAIRHPLLGLTSLAICGCWTMGFVTLTVGHLNILSVAFVVTLIGLGIDYGIVWLSRYEAQRARGGDNRTANATAATTVGPGIVTGAVTTAAAFLTTISTGFLGLQEMGWIAGCGILICMAGTFTILPALLTVFGRTDLSIRDRFASERPFWPSLDRRPKWVLAGFGAAVVVLVCGMPMVRMDYNLLNLQERGLPSVQWEHELIERTGSSGFYALSVAATAEHAIALRKKFEQLPTVGRVVEIASLVPKDQEAKTAAIAGIARALAPLPAREKPPRFGESKLGELSKRLEAIAGANANWTKSPTAELFLEAARRCQTAIASVSETEADRRLARFERRLGVDLIDSLHELKSASTPIPVNAADLPEVLVERYRSAAGNYLLQIFPKDSVWDMPPLKAFVAELESVDPQVTGHPVTAMHSLTTMTNGYLHSAELALVVIFLSVYFDFRNLRDALLAMLPLGVGCISMLGIMGWTGLSFNPANTIALPLVLGVGVNYGVYMIHDHRRSTGHYILCRRLARAIGLSALTTIIGFASLLCANHWGMISIGLVLSIGVSACLLNVLFFLPPLLNASRLHRTATETHQPKKDGMDPAIVPFPIVAGPSRQAA